MQRFAVAMICFFSGISSSIAETRTWSFNAETVGAPPKGFAFDRTGTGRQGKWVIVGDEVTKTSVLAQQDADPADNRFPVAVADGFNASDVDLSVKFKPVSGSVDMAAGLVWRYRDKDNYYIVRANALEDNVVLYKVQNGRRIDLPLKGLGKTYGAKAPVPKGQWSLLRVTATGPLFTVYLNGKELYAVEDKTFVAAGKIGVWTKADSVTAFDALTVITP